MSEVFFVPAIEPVGKIKIDRIQQLLQSFERAGTNIITHIRCSVISGAGNEGQRW
jgi:hypothetical protein